MLVVEARHELLVLLSSLGHVVVGGGRTATVVRVQHRGGHFCEFHDRWVGGAQGGQEGIGSWCDEQGDCGQCKESDDV